MNNSSNLRRLPPLQYDFGSRWLTELRPLFERPKVAAEFEKLKNEFCEMFISSHEAGDLGEGREAELRLQSYLLSAEANYQNLHWLREQFEGGQLSNLVLSIARELKPLEEWEIVEKDDIHSVVTNPMRTIVFDILDYDQLTAEAALLYAGDKTFQNRDVDDGLKRYLEEKNTKFQDDVIKGATLTSIRCRSTL